MIESFFGMIVLVFYSNDIFINRYAIIEELKEMSKISLVFCFFIFKEFELIFQQLNFVLQAFDVLIFDVLLLNIKIRGLRLPHCYIAFWGGSFTNFGVVNVMAFQEPGIVDFISAFELLIE